MKKYIHFPLLLLCFTAPAAAQTCYWQGIDSVWNNAANWSCGHAPGWSDTAVINSGFLHYPRLDGDLGISDSATHVPTIPPYRCARLVVNSGASLRFTTGAVNCHGSCTYNGTMWGGGINGNFAANITMNGAALYQGSGVMLSQLFIYLPVANIVNSYIEGRSGIRSTSNSTPYFGTITNSVLEGAADMFGTVSSSGTFVKLKEKYGGSFSTFPECLGACTAAQGILNFNIQNSSPADDTVAIQLWGGTSLAGNIVFNTSNECGIMRIRRSAYDNGYAGGQQSQFSTNDTIIIQGNVTIVNKGNIIFNNPYKITGTVTLNGGRIIKAWKGAVNSFPPGDTLRCPLNLGLGTLSLAGGRLYTENLLAADSIASASAAGYIVTTAPNGRVQLAVKNYPRLFPVGTSSTYNPATLANTGTADNFSVQVAPGVYANGSSGGLITSKVVDRTWYINEAVPGGSNVNLTLQWNSTEELAAFIRSNCNIAHYNGSYWDGAASVAAGGSDPYTVSRSGLVSFSPFSVGRQGVLAAEGCARLSAIIKPQGMLISWQNNSSPAEYQLQRSSNGVQFSTIYSTAGNPATALYNYTDRQYNSGINYYRLLQTNAAGAAQTCPVIQTAAGQRAASAALLQNPVSNVIQLQLYCAAEQYAECTLYTTDGRRAGSNRFLTPGGSAVHNLHFGALQPGIYLLKVTSKDIQQTLRVLMQ